MSRVLTGDHITTDADTESVPAATVDAAASVWFDPGHSDIDTLKSLTGSPQRPEAIPLASAIDKGIPVYDGNQLREQGTSARQLMAEWHNVLLEGAGVFVIRQAFADTRIIDDSTRVFERLMVAEAEGHVKSDHFAAAGSNTRLWNAHEKLCRNDPECFIRYNANVLLQLAYTAWLGPLYQVTAQVNLVHPGGRAQVPHRDYHMGFQSEQQLLDYPRAVHHITPHLTLQGAIAHTDMPVESGPTRLLPHSQRLAGGYVSAHREAVREYFAAEYVQLPLRKGDALFFNPALLHAAGDNDTEDVQRFGNLLQISSGFGRAMELLDRTGMCRAVYPGLRQMQSEQQIDRAVIDAVVAATAEGYPFPADLEIDPPVNGLAPQSQQQLLHEALAADWSTPRFVEALNAQASRRRKLV